MALTPQMLELGRKLHPKFFNDVDENNNWRGTYPVSLLPASTLHKFRNYDRVQGPAATSDAEQRINPILDDFRAGEGLKNPIVLSHNNRSNRTWVDEGHHRIEAARRHGSIILPTVAQVQDYGGSPDNRAGVLGGSAGRRVREVSHDPYGWFPKVTDPDKLIAASN